MPEVTLRDLRAAEAIEMARTASLPKRRSAQAAPRNRKAVVRVGTGDVVRPDRTNKAAVIADTLCRRIYGTPLKHSGGRLPELIADAFAVLDALDKLEAGPNAALSGAERKS